ncbi:MAG: sodium:solute symporter family protein [Bacteroidales bacterium]|jgi:SSS family solute:Na+ symporter|nr:sodium:solute symporter family protein [Bacteroidales bacterium]MDD3550159.1 sodium:solute symporter family protein [Bacteroidales bacterium]NLF82291.1 sodium:solute symporter family protein [Bacteroidales bacterium]
MTVVDYVIFLVYFLTMLGVGFYFYKKNKNLEDYYVGGRSLKSWHIGLSVVATDVGGGFSIGLGGLGFVMGVSGSWMLFTGLIGAWLSAVVLIPVIVKLSAKHKFFTFPQLFHHFYNGKVAMIAGVISAIGYIGFTSSQLLAGAKLASATFAEIDMTTALIIMGVVAVVYTGIGGLKAVIYTDTIQWLILMCGLVLIGIPIAYSAIGGMDVIRATIGKEFLSMTNVTWQQLVNWGVTIIPIWFVGMTLYQRIYASKNKKQAQRAWFIAGLFEWPLMALMGTVLGMFARVAFENGMFTAAGYPPGAGIDSETALPVLLNTVLPAGLMGLMLAAYFSAILSTADSCLMAASGNVQTDILDRIFKPAKGMKAQLRISQIITLAIGVLALVLAHSMSNVLELMLYSYAFMVSGLFVPILAALYTRKPKAAAALPAMIAGGTTTILLILLKVPLPFGLNENIFGITVSAVFYILISIFTRKSNQKLSNP